MTRGQGSKSRELEPHRRRSVLVVMAVLAPVAASCGRGRAARQAADFFSGLSAGPPAAAATWGDAHTFGSIDGFALLDSGVAVVSDATKGHLHLFIDGRDALTFGRLGPEPGDFATLGAVVALPADTFVVLDPNRGRLETFRRVADSVTRLGSIALPFPVTGVCSTGGHLFVLGRYDSTLVHETTTGGRVLRSFGVLEGSGAYQIGLNAAAEIACSQEPGSVAVASRVPGELRIFSASGELVRRDSIPSFVRSAFSERGMSAGPPPGSKAHWNTVERLHWFRRNLLVQIARYPRTDSLYESRWLLASGGWKGGLPSWPRILAHTSDGRVYAAVTDPYPSVQVYQILR